MPTVQKVFHFTSDLEGWTLVPNTDVTMVRITTDGAPGSEAGCIQSTLATKNRDRVSYLWWGGTWENLGVPAGAVVTEVGTPPDNDYDWRCTTYTSGGASNQVGPFDLRDSADALQGTFSAALGFSALSAWATRHGAAVAVPSALQGSGSTIRLRLSNRLHTANTTGATIVVQQDKIILLITYLNPPSGAKLYLRRQTTRLWGGSYTDPVQTDQSIALPAGGETFNDRASAVSGFHRGAHLMTLQKGGNPNTYLQWNVSAIITAQDTHFVTFRSRPLRAQTIPAGVWKVAVSVSEESADANAFLMLSIGANREVDWQRAAPTTGGHIGYITDQHVSRGAEWATTPTGRVVTFLGAALVVPEGAILRIELWAHQVQGAATAFSHLFYFDGNTEPLEGVEQSDAASYLQPPSDLDFLPENQTVTIWGQELGGLAKHEGRTLVVSPGTTWGNFADAWGSIGGSDSVFYSGRFSMRINSTSYSSPYRYIETRIWEMITAFKCFAHFRFRTALTATTWPAVSTIFQTRGGNNRQRVDPDVGVALRRVGDYTYFALVTESEAGAQTIIGTGAVAIQANAWYTLQLDVPGMGSQTHVLRVYNADGSSLIETIQGTVVLAESATRSFINYAMVGIACNQRGMWWPDNFYWDDLIIRLDAAVDPRTRVWPMYPEENATYTDFVGDYQDVDDTEPPGTGPDDATTVITSDAADQKETFRSLAPTVPSGVTVVATQVTSRVRSISSEGQSRVLYRSGGVDRRSEHQFAMDTFSGAWTNHWDPRDQDPWGSAWTRATLYAMEWGYERIEVGTAGVVPISAVVINVAAWAAETAVEQTLAAPLEGLLGSRRSLLANLEARGAASRSLTAGLEGLGAVRRLVGAQVEALQGVRVLAAPTIEALLGARAARVSPYEAAGPAARTAAVPHETLLRLERAHAAPHEFLLGVGQQVPTPAEALVGLLLLGLVNYETAGTVGAVRAAPHEASGTITQTAVVQQEALTRLAVLAQAAVEAVSDARQESTAGIEALLSLVRADAAPVEALAGLEREGAVPIEMLLGLVRGAAVPVEALLELRAQGEAAHEAVAHLYREAVSLWESLVTEGAVARELAAPMEARGIVAAAVTVNLEALLGLAREDDATIEALLGLAREGVTFTEALAELLWQAEVPVEAMLGLRLERGVPWEAQQWTGEVARDLVVPMEARGAVVTITAVNAEALAEARVAAGTLWEALAGLRQEDVTPHEAAGRIHRALAVAHEAFKVVVSALKARYTLSGRTGAGVARRGRFPLWKRGMH